MANSSFASLFNISEEDLMKKGKRKEEKPAAKKANEKQKKQAGLKSSRFPLPVRIRCGYIQTEFTAENYDGKTIDEKTIKIKLREKYPELSGVSFTLKDISVTVSEIVKIRTRQLEQDLTKLEKPAEALELLVTDSEESEETEAPEDQMAAETEKNSQEYGLSADIPDFAGAEAEASDDDGKDSEEETVPTEQAVDVSAEVTAGEKEGGCWLTLQIYYQEVSEKQKLSFPLTLMNGDYQIPVQNAIGIEDMRQLWIESYPEYKGCKLYYDDRRNLLVPFMEIKKEQNLSTMDFKLPITVGFLHLSRVYTGVDFGPQEMDTVTLEEIREVYGCVYPEYRYSTYCYNEEDNSLFPVITRDEKVSGSERMAVPVTIRLLGSELVLQESDFKGKLKVSLEEVRQVIEEIYPEYSKERTEMLVDQKGFVVPILRGSRKGYIMKPGKNGHGLYIVEGRDGYTYRVEKTPLGIFECRINGTMPCFYLIGQKIPMGILEQVMDFFKYTPTREAAVQLFFMPGTGTYEIYIPEQDCTGSSVNFRRSLERENQGLLVMDIHSHGIHPAFFSSVDDDDEKGTRLYLVFGNLNTDRITCLLRAGIAGSYQPLKLEDVFEGGMESWTVI